MKGRYSIHWELEEGGSFTPRQVIGGARRSFDPSHQGTAQCKRCALFPPFALLLDDETKYEEKEYPLLLALIDL